MTDPSSSPREPLRHEESLLEYFERGAKPAESWGVGLEYERLGLFAETGEAIPYHGPRGVERILRELSTRFGWEPQVEDDRVIGLTRGPSALTLEPGGQLELSGAVHAGLASLGRELAEHIRETGVISAPLGIAWVPIGLQPFTHPDEIGWVPKGRYRILAPFLKPRGPLSHHMMKATAGMQLNFDYSDESDACDKLRTAVAVSSILTAACANSPLCGGEPCGFMSRRAHIWTETDPQRCGILEFAFREDLTFRHYLEYALDVPVIFVRRDARWIPAEGVPFRRFLRDGWEGLHATHEDWVLHLTTIFTEVRLKTYVEVRGMDSVPPAVTLAVAALWKGILYEAGARRRAWDLVAKASLEDRISFHRQAAIEGPAARLRGVPARELARELIGIAREGLRIAQGRAYGAPEEESLLTPLLESLDGEGACPAARLQRAWLAGGSREPRDLIRYASRETESFVETTPTP